MIDDTIAAIATPLGEGGLAIIRLSGKQALAIAEKCFEPIGNASAKPTLASTHTLNYGRIVHDGREIDEVLLAVLKAPRTFTREDTAEIALTPANLLGAHFSMAASILLKPRRWRMSSMPARTLR
jgi:tRNA modification GTPase